MLTNSDDEWIEGAYKIYCDSVCVCVCARAHHGYKFLPAKDISPGLIRFPVKYTPCVLSVYLQVLAYGTRCLKNKHSTPRPPDPDVLY